MKRGRKFKEKNLPNYLLALLIILALVFIFFREREIMFGPEGVGQPSLSFVWPTPENGSFIKGAEIYVNISSFDESGEHSVSFDWNRSLRLWIRMDDGDGMGNLTDISSYSNNGTANDSVFVSNGKYGGAYNFDGRTDSIIIPTNPSLDIRDEMTLNAWVYPRSNGSYGSGDYNFKYVVSKPTDIYSVPYIIYAINFKKGGKFRFAISSGGIQHEVTYELPINEWSHVVGTYSNITSNNLSLYINGELVNTTHVDAGKIDVSLKNVRIGSYEYQYIESWNGSIDDVQIYSRALSADEIRAYYNAGVYQYEKNFPAGDGEYEIRAWAQNLSGGINFIERKVVVDNQMPYISNIQNSSITNNSAVISWQIDEKANGRVWYSLSAENFGNSVFNASYLLNHIIDLSNLIANTTYYYKVESCDSAGNCANSSIFDFMTLENNATFVDIDGPVIFLNKPAEGYLSSTKEVEFNYTASDYSIISNCTLYVGAANRTEFNIINWKDNVLSLSLENGNYAWNVSCYDILGNLRVSGSRVLKVNYVALGNTGNSGSSGSSGSSGNDGNIAPKVTAQNLINKTEEIIVENFKEISLGEELVFLDVANGEKIIIDLFNQRFDISFGIDGNGVRVIGEYGENWIPTGDVLSVLLGDREMYAGIKSASIDSAQLVLGLDRDKVLREIIWDEGSSGAGEKKSKRIYFYGALILFIIAIVLVFWYLMYIFKRKKQREAYEKLKNISFKSEELNRFDRNA